MIWVVATTVAVSLALAVCLLAWSTGRPVKVDLGGWPTNAEYLVMLAELERRHRR